MAERYGAIVSPGTGADPGLAVILDYLQTWMNAYEGDAWRALAPAAVGGTSVPVKTVHTHDPEERSFNERDLPALYVSRQRGRPQELAPDLEMSEDELHLHWVYPPVPQGRQKARDPFATRIARAVRVALRKCAFSLWVHERDEADADAFRLSTATVTTEATHVGAALSGAVGAGPLPSPRFVTATATAVTGAYALTPILVEGIDAAGDYVTDTLTPLSVNGGWQLVGTVEMVRVTRIVEPAQTLTTGAISYGHTEDEVAVARGSLLATHAGHETLRLTEAIPDVVDIQIQGGQTRRYEALRMTLVSVERHTTDLEDDSDALTESRWLINASSSDADGFVPMFERDLS